MTKELRKRLLWKYKDGTKCGEIDDELLLMVGEKSVLNVDVYVLISSTKPLIVYSSEMLDQDKKFTHADLVLKLEVIINKILRTTLRRTTKYSRSRIILRSLLLNLVEQ